MIYVDAMTNLTGDVYKDIIIARGIKQRISLKIKTPDGRTYEFGIDPIQVKYFVKTPTKKGKVERFYKTPLEMIEDGVHLWVGMPDEIFMETLTDFLDDRLILGTEETNTRYIRLKEEILGPEEKSHSSCDDDVDITTCFEKGLNSKKEPLAEQ